MRQHRHLARLWTAGAAVAASALGPAAFGGTDLWTGAVPLTGTLSTTSNPTTITYGSWDSSTANFNPVYTPGDDVVFNDNTTGTTNVAPTSSAQTPNSVSFNHASGGTAETFVFLRASTTAGTSASNSGVADSFSSGSPFGASSQSIVLLNPGFLGTVDLRARANTTSQANTGTGGVAIAGVYQSAVISSGTLLLEDAAALPGSNGTNVNSPNINLAGGNLVINVDTGGNAGPSSSQLAGILSVTANGQLANGQATMQSNFYNGTIAISPGVTLMLNPGVGVAGKLAFNGGGTVSLGGSTGFVRTSATAGAAAAFDLGSAAASYQPGGSSSFGALTATGTNTVLYASNAAVTTAAATDTMTIGALNTSTTFNGQLANGSAAGAVIGGPAQTPLALRPLALTKAGTGTLTLTGTNIYAGGTTVTAGTLQAGSAHAFADSAATVTLTGGTMDFNGNSPVAGQAIALNGGSLVNNGTAAVTLATAASGSVANTVNTTVTPNVSFGANLVVGSGTTPVVTVTGGGGTGATAAAQMQVSSVLAAAGGSGYTALPTVTVSAPANGGRTAVVVPVVSGGSVASFTVVDPGSGYTTVPTLTLTGGGGTGATATVNGVISGLVFGSGGTGYTSAPTITVTNVSSGTTAGTAPTITGNFGQLTLTASSSIGGSGPLTVNPVIADPATATTVFPLTKIGAGTTTLGGANTYAGGTTVAAGTLATGAAGTLGTGGVTVAGTATLTLGNAASIGDAATLTFADGSKVNLNAAAGTTEVVAALVDSSTNLTLTAPGTYTAAQLDARFADNDFLSQFGETFTIVAAPEPTSLLLAATAAAPLALGRRRRRSTGR